MPEAARRRLSLLQSFHALRRGGCDAGREEFLAMPAFQRFGLHMRSWFAPNRVRDAVYRRTPFFSTRLK